MKSVPYKLTEFFILFILLPVSFTFNYLPTIKLSIGFIGFIYVMYVLLKIEKSKIHIETNLNWNQFLEVYLH